MPLLEQLVLFGSTALLVCSPLIPGEVAAVEGAGLVIVILWLVVLAAWALAGIATGSLKLRVGATMAAALVLLGCYAVSATVTAGQGSARATINGAWQWAGFVVLYFIARQAYVTAASRRALVAVMMALAVGLAMFGHYQYLYDLPRTQEHYERDPEGALREAGVVGAAEGSAIRRQFDSRLRTHEPFATFALTNSLAGFLIPWLVISMGIAAQSWFGAGGLNPAAPRVRRALIVAGLAVVIASCVALTKSRSAYLALLAAVAVLLIVGWRARWFDRSRAVWAGWGLLGLLAAATGLAWWIDPLIITEAPKSLLYRWQYWQAALRLLADYPWFGTGPGNFQQYYTAYKLPEASETVADPHNFLLEIWATGGTFTFLAWLATLLIFLRQWLRWRKQTDVAQPDVDALPSPPAPLIYAGGMTGIVLAFPLGFVAGFVPHAAVLWWVLPWTLITLVLLHGWVHTGALPTWLLPLGAAALLINLLAAGGIGYPGVAQNLWLLAALALNQVEPQRLPWVLPRLPASAVMLGTLLLILACHKLAFQPVVLAHTRVLQGQVRLQQGARGEALQLFRQAAEADPYWSEPWWQLAILHEQAWQSTRSQEQSRRFQHAADQALARNSRSAMLHRQLGDLYLRAFRASGEQRYLNRATQLYRQAIQLYPHSGILHAQLAWTYHVGEKPAAARREAAEALRLDDLHPHSEQKLGMQQIFDVPPAPGVSEQVAPPPAGANAELLMKQLRKEVLST